MCFYGCKKSSKETVGSPDTAEVVGQYTTDPTYVPKYDALSRPDRGEADLALPGHTSVFRFHAFHLNRKMCSRQEKNTGTSEIRRLKNTVKRARMSNYLTFGRTNRNIYTL